MAKFSNHDFYTYRREFRTAVATRRCLDSSYVRECSASKYYRSQLSILRISFISSRMSRGGGLFVSRMLGLYALTCLKLLREILMYHIDVRAALIVCTTSLRMAHNYNDHTGRTPSSVEQYFLTLLLTSPLSAALDPVTNSFFSDLKLDSKNIRAEYVWIDAIGNTRSKTR